MGSQYIVTSSPPLLLLSLRSSPLSLSTPPPLSPFLSCSIPNLEFDGLSVKLDGPDLEVDSDGGDVGLGVGVVGETEEETTLSYSAISNKKELEEVVVFGRHISEVRGNGV